MPALSTSNSLFYSRIAYLPCLLLILAITVGLKLHYSRADSDALDWILGPTAAVTEIISGIPFDPEPLTGYISRDARAIIAPACAGVNFMIIAFGMTAFHGILRLDGAGRKLGWMAGALIGAYLVTVGVNSLRIIAAVHLYGVDIYGSLLTPRNVHRAAGIGIYFAALSALYPLSGKLAELLRTDGRPAAASAGDPKMDLKSLMVPFCWYAAVTLGIPLLHRRALLGNPLFRQHFLTLTAVCAVVLIVFLIGRLCYQYVNGLIVRSRFELPFKRTCRDIAECKAGDNPLKRQTSGSPLKGY